jgi:hypothetical protein
MEILDGNKLNSHPISGLSWKRDLIYFEGPLLSEFSSSTGETYLKYWCDCDEEFNRWMFFKIKEQDRLRLVLGEKSIHEVIKNQPDGFVFFADENDHNSIFKMIIATDIPHSYMPEEDSFLDIEDYEEEANIISLIFENEWEFKALQDVYRKFTQVYDFLFVSNKVNKNLGSAMPWQGGFSTYHFYNKIKEFIPKLEQSNLNAIHYASPGYMKISSQSEIANLALEAIQDYSENKKAIDSNYLELGNRIKELELNQMSPGSAILEFAADAICLQFYSQLKDDLLGIDPIWLNSFVASDFERCKMLMGHFRRLKSFHGHLGDEAVRVVTNIIK